MWRPYKCKVWSSTGTYCTISVEYI